MTADLASYGNQQTSVVSLHGQKFARASRCRLAFPVKHVIPPEVAVPRSFCAVVVLSFSLCVDPAFPVNS